MSNENPNTPSSPSCRTRPRTLSYRPARGCFCRSPTASKHSPTTMEKSSPLTSRSQPRWGRYPILPNPITRGNAASTNTPTAYSDSTSQKVQISLLCPIPRSKGSRISSTLVPERYSAIELLVRFSSTPKISPLHFAVEWAFGFNAQDELQYRGRLDASRTTPIPNARRDLFEAMKQVAETGRGPPEQMPS